MKKNAHEIWMLTGAEFKEIRKEWKARKKEEEAQRKAEDERQRAQAQAAAANGGPEPGHDGAPASSYPGSRQPVQLPPIGYQPQYPAPPSGVGQQPLPEYGATGHMYPSYQPHSPYGQPSQNMYSQCKSDPASAATLVGILLTEANS